MTQVIDPPAPTVPAPPRPRRPWVRGDDRWLGGCASGLAARYGVDPALVRGVALLLGFIGGAVVLVYGLAWLILPDRHGTRVLGALRRGAPQPALAVALGMILIGGLRPLVWFPQEHGGWYELMVAYLLGIAAVLLVAGIRQRLRHRRRKPARVPHASPGAPSSPTPAEASDTEVAVADVSTAETTGSAVPAVPGRQAKAPRPRLRRRTPGPGRRTVLITLALAMLTGAAILLSSREQVSGGTWFAVAGAALAVLGAGVVTAGARGRRGGVLTALAVLTLPAATAAVAAAALLPAGLLTDPTAIRSWSDVVRLSATTPDAAPTLFGTLDIAAADESAPTGRTTPFHATVGVGSIRMAVNEGEAVTFRVHAGLGEVRLHVPSRWEWDQNGETSGVSIPSDFGTPPHVKQLAWIPLTVGPNETIVVRTPAATDREPGFIADLNLGIGTITLTETPTPEEQN